MAHPGGRPSDYKEEYNEKAYKLALLGATDKQMADFFDVAESTLNKWKLEHKEFSESLKRGKDVADTKVAESLYKRALGYDCKATKFATFEGQITDTMDYIEHHAPDTTACIFWLKNRQREQWRDKVETTNENTNLNANINREVTDVSTMGGEIVNMMKQLREKKELEE